MHNRTINIAIVAQVAQALKPLQTPVVFVGGAVVSVYVNDEAADEVRPTQDIDMAVHILNFGQWEALQQELAELGFHPDPNGHSICSYTYKDVAVDIMTVEEGPLGPANRWYKIGFENLWAAKALDQPIQILSAPCFLATKFEAFNNRGHDYRTSHDIEDIIYLLDNRSSLVQEIQEDEESIRSFICDQFQNMKDEGILEEALMAHIHPLQLEQRLPLIHEKIEHLLSSQYGI